jgi:Acetyltransferase (GNAT) domain
MNEHIVLRHLPAMTGAEWDHTVAAYPDATVFHRSCWHACLERSLPGRVVHFQIEAAGQVCGHWCGFLLHKFGASVLGAPLPGSGTDYMYPLFSEQPPVGAFLGGVRTWAKQRRIAMVDLGGEYFSEAELAAHGYQTHYTQTYRVDLSEGADAVWKNLKPAMRNKIRKAEKSGVAITSDTSPEFPARFSEMLQATFSRKGLVPTYGPKRIETVVRTLAESDRVVTLTAWKGEDALAAVILLVDGATAYFWGGASFESAYPVGANDLIHWHALQLVICRGVRVYDTCGGGDYKTKFGGTHVRIPGGHVCISPLFGAVRAVVRNGFRAQRVVMGQARRIARRFR